MRSSSHESSREGKENRDESDSKRNYKKTQSQEFHKMTISLYSKFRKVSNESLGNESNEKMKKRVGNCVNEALASKRMINLSDS